MRRLLLVCMLVAAAFPQGAQARPPWRLLYSSDLRGPAQLFAADPAGRQPLAQVTFGRLPSCFPSAYPVTCGFIDPVPAPDGRHFAYRTYGVVDNELWVADANGAHA